MRRRRARGEEEATPSAEVAEEEETNAAEEEEEEELSAARRDGALREALLEAAGSGLLVGGILRYVCVSSLPFHHLWGELSGFSFLFFSRQKYIRWAAVGGKRWPLVNEREGWFR